MRLLKASSESAAATPVLLPAGPSHHVRLPLPPTASPVPLPTNRQPIAYAVGESHAFACRACGVHAALQRQVLRVCPLPPTQPLPLALPSLACPLAAHAFARGAGRLQGGAGCTTYIQDTSESLAREFSEVTGQAASSAWAPESGYTPLQESLVPRAQRALFAPCPCSQAFAGTLSGVGCVGAAATASTYAFEDALAYVGQSGAEADTYRRQGRDGKPARAATAPSPPATIPSKQPATLRTQHRPPLRSVLGWRLRTLTERRLPRRRSRCEADGWEMGRQTCPIDACALTVPPDRCAPSACRRLNHPLPVPWPQLSPRAPNHSHDLRQR